MRHKLVNVELHYLVVSDNTRIIHTYVYDIHLLLIIGQKQRIAIARALLKDPEVS
jgi:ABC-type transport system involved in Fe-S cluster assembly fused permease/ATPase subunit